MDLTPWGSPPVGERLGGGHRNEVYRLGDDRVVRRSRRSAASLEWELDLLDHLARNGFVVPAVVRTHDGRRHVDGLVVQHWLPGEEPTGDDWPLVTAELRRLHATMTDWPPRPDFPGTRDLLRQDRGGDVDLSAMPPDAAAACRAAWRALTGPSTVVHGDPCAANIRMKDGRVGFLDWDEARVDHPWLDLADIPGMDVPRTAKAAINAWEAVNAWFMEPSYARRRLAQVPVDNFVDN
jgi:Ser/Thr protein kinase RdoA (MazF antagonist)